MNGCGQSDRFVVPANPPNKAAAAEAGEERERAKGNTAGETRPGRSAGPGVSSELGRVRQVAQKGKEARFTALLHHVSLERLVMAYWDLRPKAAPGVDGVTWAAYGQDLVANLRDLHERVQQGRYRASPGRRVYIPKADGRQRPLGIATLEDKIVQRAVVEARPGPCTARRFPTPANSTTPAPLTTRPRSSRTSGYKARCSSTAARQTRHGPHAPTPKPYSACSTPITITGHTCCTPTPAPGTRSGHSSPMSPILPPWRRGIPATQPTSRHSHCSGPICSPFSPD